MAAPKRIVEAVSENMGVPLGTVVIHDRNLSVAGLRSAGIRGRGKSVATSHDAANLIIAVAGSRNAKDSVETVEKYGRLRPLNKIVFTDKFGEIDIEVNDFADFIAKILEFMPNKRESFRNPDEGYVKVVMSGPNPVAMVEILFDGTKFDFQFRNISDSREHKMYLHDLQYSSTFTQITLGFVGEALLM